MEKVRWKASLDPHNLTPQLDWAMSIPVPYTMGPRLPNPDKR